MRIIDFDVMSTGCASIPRCINATVDELTKRPSPCQHDQAILRRHQAPRCAIANRTASNQTTRPRIGAVAAGAALGRSATEDKIRPTVPSRS
jgi:hypothetical protein